MTRTTPSSGIETAHGPSHARDRAMSGRGRHLLVAATAAAALMALNIAPTWAAVDIGVVRAVTLAAYGTPPAESRKALYKRDDVFTREVVETVRNGALHLTFDDDTSFRLGASSRATLDKFIYDPDSKAGEMTLNLKEGIFRIKTGKLKKEGIRVVTPVAVITVNGTDFIVEVRARDIRVSVIDGEVSISPTAPGASPVTLGETEVATMNSVGTATHEVDPGVGAALLDAVSDDKTVDSGRGGSNSSY